MCALVRCTARRTVFSWWILRRVCAARRSRAVFFSIMACYPLLLLGLFYDHLLVGVPDTLALVGLRRPVGTHFGINLTDQLLVQSLDQDFGLRGRLDPYARGHRMHYRVRIAESQIELVPLRLCTVAHANQRELLLEALGDALHHVGRQCAQRSGHRIRSSGLFADLKHKLVAVPLDFYTAIEMLRERPQGTLDRQRFCGKRHIDAFRKCNRNLADTRHGYTLTPRCTALRRRCRWRAPCGLSSDPSKSTRWRSRGRSLPEEYCRVPGKCEGQGATRVRSF